MPPPPPGPHDDGPHDEGPHHKGPGPHDDGPHDERPHHKGPGPHEVGSGHEMGGEVSWREYDWLSPERIGKLLTSFGEELAATGQIELDGGSIGLDTPSYFEGRKERGPGGEERLVFEIEWMDRNTHEDDPGHAELHRRLSHDSSETDGDSGSPERDEEQPGEE